MQSFMSRFVCAFCVLPSALPHACYLRIVPCLRLRHGAARVVLARGQAGIDKLKVGGERQVKDVIAGGGRRPRLRCLLDPEISV